MEEKEVQIEKEAEVPAATHYEKTMQERKQEIERARKGIKVIRGKNRPWEINQQGVIRNYSHYDYLELANNNWNIFCHEIRQHSGRHRHQGGINLFVIKGKGYTVVDSKRFDWEEGDLILLPIKKGGVEHQHFNLGGSPSKWVAFRHRSTPIGIGAILEQTENFMLYRGKEQK